ncbi:hypothetical protein DIURU_003530 [Diutina rugosa]|uniref:Aminotransferase class I/classII large domain-containing protein n=1 Tax=Diutina rugosa TaxID=5481 RepID=A0A642UL76_DIURU|nr:uncharacterized protein DIURU_003530 [Diutina rugosa]KAA8901160.1 hypothetical protein DIURU_003530 [Diutina rugosa]
MKQEPFAVEQYMDKYETSITHNMGETCVESLRLNEVLTADEMSTLMQKQLTYGAIHGSDELTSQIAQLYSNLDQKQVVVANGAIGANFLGFYSIINPGMKVVVVTPTYQQLVSVPAMFGATVSEYRLQFDHKWQPQLDALEQAVAADTDVLVVNNPNNPTGVVWDDATMEAVVAICRKHNVLLYSDEVYRPLYHSTTNPPKSAIDYGYDRVVVSGSMSKAFSLAGVRVGWLASRSPSIIEDLWLKRDYNTISVSMVDDFIAAKALAHREEILKRNYDICRKNLKTIGDIIAKHHDLVEWVVPTGGSTCFLKVKADTARLGPELAEKYQTLVVPGETFGYPGFIRVGYGNDPKAIEGGLQQLAKVLSGVASAQ